MSIFSVPLWQLQQDANPASVPSQQVGGALEQKGTPSGVANAIRSVQDALAVQWGALSQVEASQRITDRLLKSPDKIRRLKQDVANQWYAEDRGYASYGELLMAGSINQPVLHRPEVPAFPNLTQQNIGPNGQRITSATGALVSTYNDPKAEFSFIETKGILSSRSFPFRVFSLGATLNMTRRKVWFALDPNVAGGMGLRAVLRSSFNGEVKAEYPIEFGSGGIFATEVLLKFNLGATLGSTSVADDEALVWKAPTLGNFVKMLPYRSNQAIDTWELIISNFRDLIGGGTIDAFMAVYSEYSY